MPTPGDGLYQADVSSRAPAGDGSRMLTPGDSCIRQMFLSDSSFPGPQEEVLMGPGEALGVRLGG